MSAICTGSIHACWKMKSSFGESHTSSAGASTSIGGRRPPRAEHQIAQRDAEHEERGAHREAHVAEQQTRSGEERLERRVHVRHVVANDLRRGVDDVHDLERVLPVEDRLRAARLDRPHVDVRNRREPKRLEHREGETHAEQREANRSATSTRRESEGATQIRRDQHQLGDRDAHAASTRANPRSMRSRESMSALTMKSAEDRGDDARDELACAPRSGGGGSNRRAARPRRPAPRRPAPSSRRDSAHAKE